jgi:ABC-type polysaccharide/polyol phosphate transport system ATPase subunit
MPDRDLRRLRPPTIGGLRDRFAGVVDPSLPAIVVDGVTETFRLFHERPSGLKERLARVRRSSYTDFNALEDVSFSIDHGESVAVIGHNGSGKSTLLKILARILPPDRGVAVTNGRVASLLELGAGLPRGPVGPREHLPQRGHPRAVPCRDRRALRRDRGRRRHPALLDTAVRTYSSGLYVRLGFAIAVTVDPDILLVDEVLAVGDAEFQERSLDRMRRFRDEGKTFVLVSHDLDAVREMCDRAIVLDRGRVVFDGNVSEGVELYRQRVATGAAPQLASRTSRRVRIEEVTLLDVDGDPVTEVVPSAAMTLRVRLRALEELETCGVGITVSRGDGTHLYELHTTWQGIGIGPLAPEQEATVDVRFAARLLAGHFASPSRSPTRPRARPGRWPRTPPGSRSDRHPVGRAWSTSAGRAR